MNTSQISSPTKASNKTPHVTPALLPDLFTGFTELEPLFEKRPKRLAKNRGPPLRLDTFLLDKLLPKTLETPRTDLSHRKFSISKSRRLKKLLTQKADTQTERKLSNDHRIN
jgi:hypothetical protein